MAVSWRDQILAWLHDPPDKALDIAGHLPRARRYAAKRAPSQEFEGRR